MGYRICPYCGASLDPGERCDCQDEVATSQQETGAHGTGQADQDKHNHIDHND